MHRCSCGAELDRDVNAALNILERALSARERAMPLGVVNVGRQPVRRPITAESLTAQAVVDPYIRSGASTSNAG